MHSRFFRAAVAALLSFGLIGSAAAHSIWVEREGDGARIYFGEFDENLREGSPGLLDRLKPEAKVAGSDKALKVDKQAGFFAVAGPLAKDDSIVAENVAITERRGDKPTKVLNRLGARTVADFKELPAVNTLDIVPAGKPGLFKVFYQGKPLAKAKAELIAESGWKREFKTDEQGAVRSDPAVARRLRDRGRSTPMPRRASWARRPTIRCAAPARSSSAWPTACRARRSPR